MGIRLISCDTYFGQTRAISCVFWDNFIGPGESVQIAHEIAACDALRRLFGTSEHQFLLPFDLVVDPKLENVPNVSLKEWSEAKVQESMKLVTQPNQTAQSQ